MTAEQAHAFAHRLAEAAEKIAEELGIEPGDVSLHLGLRVPEANLPPGSNLN